MTERSQRFTAASPCPICGKHEAAARGTGSRCAGYLSSDGRYAHCSREELAGSLPVEGGSTYAHRLDGPCPCGQNHLGTVHTNGNGTVKAEHKHTTAVPETVYDYGAYQVCRVGNGRGKRIWQRRPCPDHPGAYLGNLDGITLCLYRLPELAAAPVHVPVFVAEGEKAVEALRTLGAVATCSPMGAGKWRAEYNAQLAGRTVVMLPDNDAAGAAHAERVAASVAGVAAAVRVLGLPGLSERGDAWDWCAAGGTARELKRLADAAPVWVPAAVVQQAEPTPEVEILRARDLQAMAIPEPRYAIAGILPEGVTICAGRPKQGKSFLALNLAIAVAAGGKALGGLDVLQGDVLYLALEDNKRSLKKRLNTVQEGRAAPEALEVTTRFPRIDKGAMEHIRGWIARRAAARLIIIDTLQKFRPPQNGKKDAYEQDYAAMEPLLELGQEHQLSILFIHHTRKLDADDPFDAIAGTTGLTGAADALWLLKRVRGQDNATLMTVGRLVAEQQLGLEWDSRITSWRYVGEGAEFAVSQERRLILDVLRTEGEALDPKQIAMLTEKRYDTVRKLLWHMSRAGLVLQDADRRFRLPTTGSSHTSHTRHTSHTSHSGHTSEGDHAGMDVSTVGDVTAVTTVTDHVQTGAPRCAHCGGELRDGWCPLHKWEVE